MEFGLKEIILQKRFKRVNLVSILVVMEFGLKVCVFSSLFLPVSVVSILVVMEFGLKVASARASICEM